MRKEEQNNAEEFYHDSGSEQSQNSFHQEKDDCLWKFCPSRFFLREKIGFASMIEKAMPLAQQVLCNEVFCRMYFMAIAVRENLSWTSNTGGTTLSLLG
jgi:Zn-finger protein